LKNVFLFYPMRKRKSDEKREGNLYDKIFKENSESTFIALAAKRLKIEIASYQVIQEKIQTTLEREADFLLRVKTTEEKEMVLHIEFQTKNDSSMVYRQGEYHGIELRKYNLPIKHVVIYLGIDQPKMRDKLKPEEIYRGFELIVVHQLDSASLIASQIPEEIILAILGAFDKTKAEAVIRLICKNLKAVCENENHLRKYIKQLLVYSNLRNLDSLTNKIVREMPILYDITKDSFYLEGKEKGREEGIEKGIEEKGNAVRKMLEKGFEVKLICEILSVTPKYVKQIQEEVRGEK
jgi:predicted transposase YdaD